MKELIKKVFECLAGVQIQSALITYHFCRLIFGSDYAYRMVSQRASQWVGMQGDYRRRILYRSLIAKMGKGVVISFGALLTKPAAELGDHVYIGAYSLLGQVLVGNDTLIADQVCILSGGHQHGMAWLDIPIREQPGVFQTIHVGCDSWIGSGAIIMADVGNHCIVGASSVVTRPVEDYKIVAGNPARVIGDRRDKAAV
jgi:acetyltransferase-like isoleucine patch superfamily enzyme